MHNRLDKLDMKQLSDEAKQSLTQFLPNAQAQLGNLAASMNEVRTILGLQQPQRFSFSAAPNNAFSAAPDPGLLAARSNLPNLPGQGSFTWPGQGSFGA